MYFRNRKGPMPRGGDYGEFAELLARFHRTFEPLKDRGGEDEEDFLAIRAAVEAFAARHGVMTPRESLAERPTLSGYATPFDVQEHLSAIVRDFGLGHPQGGADDLDRAALGRAVTRVLHRYKAVGTAGDEPMEKILDPQRKERSAT